MRNVVYYIVKEGEKQMQLIQKCNFSVGNTGIEIVMQGGFISGAQSVDLHSHPNVEIHYISSGSQLLSFGESKLTLKSGTLAVIPPRLDHSFSITDGDSKRISFEIKLSQLRKGSDTFTEYSRLFSPLEPVTVNVSRSSIAPLYECMEIIRGEEAICRTNANFTLVFLKICDILRKRSSHSTEQSDSRTVILEQSDEDITVIKILNYISFNACRTLTLSEVAKAVSLSERQIQRILRSKMNAGFHELLTKRRISAAKKLLSDPLEKRTLEEIAYECGFSNYVSFWNRFKKATMLTPIEYRSKHK